MPGSSPGHAVYLNFAIGKHHNFAVTALVHLMLFMLNINDLHYFLLFMEDAENYFSMKLSKIF
ncbi:TPA: hypothetical protein MHU15_20880 [Klebsiella pneumoniae]|nr:hypothetical protein [Klebsiella pneumoniae]